MSKLKILAIHSNIGKDHNTYSATDTWRIKRPMDMLRQHMPEWTIDEQLTPIPGLAKYKNAKEFTEEELEKAFKVISGYDIIFSSYHADPTGYTMFKVAADRTGTQFVMDVDDDMFAINPDNPFWAKMDDEKVYWMQQMIRDNTWVSTTTEQLANVFRERREHSKDSVFVTPNYISDDYFHPGFDNGDKIVIGYFGGASHYKDLHETGVAEALERIMHENKKVYFKSIGMPLDTYIPRARYSFDGGKRGDAWVKELFPSMNFDIAIAPIIDNIFNQGKSNIKWQEATRAGSAFIGSYIGPYKRLKPDMAMTVMNTTESWYKALKKLVDDAVYRKFLVVNAQIELKANWRLEDNWTQYRDMFTKVHENSKKKELLSTS
jgi:hypothetical protein